MFSGIESLKEEIKTFVKIKKVNIPPEKSYITISNTKNNIIFEKERSGDKSTYNYEFSKIFTDSDDYSLIFQEISSNCINDCLDGYNYAFISYGESNSEKHNLLFSDSNSDKKGIFPRLCKILINKKEIFSISLMFVYDNKLFDINDIIENIFFNFENNNLQNKNLLEIINKIIEFGIKIQKNTDNTQEVKKIEINCLNQFYNLLHKYNNFFNFLKNADLSETSFKNINKDDNKYPYILSSSNFIYVIYLYDKNKNNEIISKISCIEFASNDNLITKNNKLSPSLDGFMFNTKTFIKNSNNIESFIIAMKKLKILDNIITKEKEINNNMNEKLKSLDKNIIINNDKINLDFKEGMDNNFVLVCKNLCFNYNKIKFRIIGCIYPNVGFNISTMETLNFLYDFQKIISVKKNNLINLEKYDIDINSIKNEEKDKIILNLREDCNTLKKSISEMQKQIDSLIDKIQKIKIKYNKQIELIKEKF